MGRHHDLMRFYQLIDRLEVRCGGKRTLNDCSGLTGWPLRGVYFFFEDGERRRGSGDGPRMVRVGTHALKEGSKSSLWGRLSQHKGKSRTAGGNHRGSIFRLIVGTAVMTTETRKCDSWGRAQMICGARDFHKLLRVI